MDVRKKPIETNDRKAIRSSRWILVVIGYFSSIEIACTLFNIGHTWKWPDPGVRRDDVRLDHGVLGGSS